MFTLYICTTLLSFYPVQPHISDNTGIMKESAVMKLCVVSKHVSRWRHDLNDWSLSGRPNVRLLTLKSLQNRKSQKAVIIWTLSDSLSYWFHEIYFNRFIQVFGPELLKSYWNSYATMLNWLLRFYLRHISPYSGTSGTFAYYIISCRTLARAFNISPPSKVSVRVVMND